MAKKETTKPKNERVIDDSIPLKVEGTITLENRPDFGFVQDYSQFRNISPSVEARLKKMVERLEAKKIKP